MIKLRYSKKALIIINLITLLFTIFIEVYETLLPFILVNVFNASMFIVGIVEGSSEALSNLLKIFGGYVSDIKSRKNLIISGLGFLSLSNITIFIASKWQEVLFSSFLKSLSEGLLIPAKDFILSNTYKRSLGKVFALNKIFENFGEFLGILVALIISSYFVKFLSIKSIFLNFGLICVFFILILLTVNFDRKIKKERKEISWRIIYPELLLYFFVLSFVNLGYSFYILKVYEYLKNQSESIGIYLVFSIFLVIFTYIAGRLHDRVSLRIFLMIISILFFVSNLSIILNPIIGFLILAAAEAFLEIGIWATIGKKIKYRKGFVFGLYHFVVGIGSFISALIAGYIWDNFSSNYPFLISALISLFSLGFIVRIKV
jgi:MFS family permease